MEVGREYFKNNNVQDLDLDVMPDWQIAVGRKQFEAVDDAAAEETADAAGVEDDQEKEATNDCP